MQLTYYNCSFSQEIRNTGKKHPLVASTLTNLASVVYTMGDMKESMKLNEVVQIYLKIK